MEFCFLVGSRSSNVPVLWFLQGKVKRLAYGFTE